MKAYSDKLYFQNGIWFSNGNTNTNYPQNGNEIYFNIEEQSFWFIHRNNCIRIAASHFLNKGDHIFDIGGGNGYVSLCLKQDGFYPTIVEPDINGVLNAQRRGLDSLVCSSLDDAFFKSNTIPNIGVFDVLEHIEDDASFLMNIHHILKKEGKIFICVPAYSMLWSDEDKHDGHFRRYTIKSLSKKVKKANFHIEYSTYFFSILPFPIFLFRTLPSILKIKRSYEPETYTKENEIKNKLVNKMLNFIWKKELKFIRNKKRILWGGSILLIATKNHMGR
jgi:SAM-dependent methyltransferase